MTPPKHIADDAVAVLARRHYGVHSPVKTTPIRVAFASLVSYRTDPLRGQVPVVDEAALLAALPARWLPCDVSKILLMVEDDGSGCAVGKPTHFRAWAKYFDAYSLTLSRETAPKPKRARARKGAR